MFSRFLASLLFTLSLLTAGCASIPSEVPALSAQLGKRIGLIGQADKTVSNLVKGTREAGETADRAREFVKDARAIRESL